jgi:hypothetical protein
MTNLNVEALTQDPKHEEKASVTQEQSLPQQKIENTQQKPNEKEPETHEDPNWRAFREARKRDRAEKEEAERRAAQKEAEAAALKAAMEAAFSKAAPNQQAYQPYGVDQPEETEEQRIERKVNAIIEQKEKQYAQEQHEREQREYPSRLSRDLPDFRSVCSQEALDYLDFHYPEVSRPLQRLPEGYEKWHDIYHAVKKLIPNLANAKKESVKADINSQKPRSMASSSPSPTGEPTRSTWQESEQKRAENWARMQRIMRGV